MTSSDRHLPADARRWDLSKHEYKPHDPFCEPGLFSIIVLAHGRPDVTRRCILSTVDAVAKYDGEVEWVMIENGQCDETYDFFDSLALDRKVIVRQKNYGINQGINQGWALSRGEWCMIHENDWENLRGTEFLSVAKDIFREKPDVGIVQLRAINDPNENWGFGKAEYSPWSATPQALQQAGVRLWCENTKKGHEYWLSHFPNGFNNNPVVIRKSLYRECGPYPEAVVGTDPRHGETEYQGRVARTDCAIAHIGMELYYHCGQVTTRAT